MNKTYSRMDQKPGDGYRKRDLRNGERGLGMRMEDGKRGRDKGGRGMWVGFRGLGKEIGEY